MPRTFGFGFRSWTPAFLTDLYSHSFGSGLTPNLILQNPCKMGSVLEVPFRAQNCCSKYRPTLAFEIAPLSETAGYRADDES